MTKIFEILPDGKISLSYRWIGAILLAVVSLSMGYGKYQTDSAQVVEDRKTLHDAIGEINNLKVAMGELKTSLDDLRDSVAAWSQENKAPARRNQ